MTGLVAEFAHASGRTSMFEPCERLIQSFALAWWRRIATASGRVNLKLKDGKRIFGKSSEQNLGEVALTQQTG
jgi:hypothetical protein